MGDLEDIKEEPVDIKEEPVDVKPEPNVVKEGDILIDTTTETREDGNYEIKRYKSSNEYGGEFIKQIEVKLEPVEPEPEPIPEPDPVETKLDTVLADLLLIKKSLGI